MASDRLLEILADGTIRGKAEARELLQELRGDYELSLGTPELIMLRAASSERRVLMGGELLSRMSVMEILNVAATANWRGDMYVYGEYRRTLHIDQGALKGARSNAPDERLGEVLFQQGVLTRAQVDELATEITAEKRFGELCIERGLIDGAALYQNLQKQAESVFFGALLEAKGQYAFVVGDAEESGTTMHIPIQGLLMEGVQRIDEMALFRDKIPSSALCPVPEEGAPAPKKLDETAEAVFRMCDGTRTIDDIARETGFGEFATTKAVYHLIQQKQVSLHAPSSVDSAAVITLVERFNEVLQDIFIAVATYGGLEQTRETLVAWIQGSGYGPFFGSSLDEFGGIEAAHVAGALKSVNVEQPLEALHQAQKRQSSTIT
ncbi:MAG: DUF4388 domain-containing protein [Myxococcota bacterium]